MSAAAQSAAAPVVEIVGVTKSYQLGRTRVAALRGVTLSVRAGEFVGLTGPSGSGKSTLLHICGLIDRPDAGSYRLDGRDTDGLSARELSLLRRERIGFVFQSFNLMPALSVYENVEVPLLLGGVGPSGRAPRIHEALERVGIGSLARRRPDELSGGQRQRVALARALVKLPTVIVADEPTANLDGETATQVIDLMRGLGRTLGTTVVVATHDVRLTSHCDRVVALTDGVTR